MLRQHFSLWGRLTSPLLHFLPKLSRLIDQSFNQGSDYWFYETGVMGFARLALWDLQGLRYVIRKVGVMVFARPALCDLQPYAYVFCKSSG